ncbi:hypothetical protein [Sinomonas atrocyanea]
MVIRRGSHLGREMDQFQANVQAFEGAEVPRGDGETLEGLLEAARSLVPYPQNEMWAVVVRGWATARVNAAGPGGPARGGSSGSVVGGGGGRA